MFRAFLSLVFAIVMAGSAFAQSSYRILAGDVLQMEVLEDPSLNRSLLVLPDGTISVPLAGTLQASGRSLDSVKQAIISALAKNFAAPPTVFLTVGQLNPATVAIAQANAQSQAAGYGLVSIYAMGEVNKVGKIDVEPGTTLLQFLSESGGLTKFAAAKRIQLRRVDRKTGLESVYSFNYKAVQNGAAAPVITLKEGDVIVVPERRLFE